MNSYLDKQIKITFGKDFDQMSEEEKREITEITLSYKDFKGDLTGVSITELLKFPNLKKCLISGFELTDDDLEVFNDLEKLRGIQFSGCSFLEVTNALRNIEIVVIDGCAEIPKKLLQGNETLRYFRAVNQSYFDVASLSGCNNLIEAYLQRSTLANILELRKLKNLKLVNLNGSKFNLLAYTHLRTSQKLQVEYDKDAPPDYSR